MAAGRIPDDIPDSAEYAETLRQLAQYFASIQRFTIALSNGDLSQSLQDVTGPVAGGLKSLQTGLRHLTWQTKQIAAGDFSLSVDFMGDFSAAFNTMVADLGSAHGQLQQTNMELTHEIEARKRAEKDLALTNVILSTQQETAIDGILMVDESNTIISYNRRFVDMWDIPRALVDAGDDEPVLQFLARLVADEEGFLAKVTYLYEHKEAKSREEILLKDGRVFDRYSAPMLGADGKYLGRIWYMRDITEQKQME
jgi:PAS domain-containing protein